MFSLIGDVVELGSNWIGYKKSQLQTKQAVESNKQRLALADDKYNSAWEMESLVKSDQLLRYILAAIILWPIIHCNFDAHAVHVYFLALVAAIPGWWISLFVLMFCSEFGISPVRNFILSIIGSIKG